MNYFPLQFLATSMLQAQGEAFENSVPNRNCVYHFIPQSENQRFGNFSNRTTLPSFDENSMGFVSLKLNFSTILL